MVSGGQNKSGGSNQSSQSMESFISTDQLPFLQNLWQQASGGILGGGTGAADITGGQRFLGAMQSNPFMAGLQQFAKPNNQMVQQNTDLLSQNLNQNLQRNLMPQIADQSIQSGGLGGGRQGIAQGLALQGTQQAFAQGAADIQNNAYNQANQATQYGANFAMQNALGGIGALGQLQGQQLAPYLSLAQILGNPAILQKSVGESSGSTKSSGWNMGFSPMG